MDKEFVCAWFGGGGSGGGGGAGGGGGQLNNATLPLYDCFVIAKEIIQTSILIKSKQV